MEVERDRVAERPWLSVVCLSKYAPELNSVEALWAHLESVLANWAFRDLGELEGDAVASTLGTATLRSVAGVHPISRAESCPISVKRLIKDQYPGRTAPMNRGL